MLPLQLLGLTSALYGIQNFASTTFVARDAPGTFARVVGVVVVLNLALQPVRDPALRRGRRGRDRARVGRWCSPSLSLMLARGASATSATSASSSGPRPARWR